MSIICLQETKLNVLDDENIRKEWHTKKVLINSVCGGGYSGTMILFNSMHIKILDTIYDNDGRVIATDIEIYKDRFHLINTYFPDGTERKHFINSLYPFIASRYPIIWCGDQNMVTDPVIDRVPSRRTRDSYTNELVTLLDTFSLRDTCREKYPIQYIYTFHRGTSKSRIDKVLVTDQFKIECYQQEDYISSDHDLIKVNLNYQAKWVPGKGVWKNNPKIFHEDNFIPKFEELWEFLKRFRTNGNSTKWWVDAKYRIKDFLRHLERIKKTNENEEIVNLKLDLERKKFLMRSDPNSKNAKLNYSNCKKKLQKEQIKIVKEKMLNEKVDEFNNGDTPNKLFFQKYKTVIKKKVIHGLKDAEGVVKETLPEIMEIAHTFFKNLFGKKNVDDNVMESFLQKLPSIDKNNVFIRNLLIPITLEELDASFSPLRILNHLV